MSVYILKKKKKKITANLIYFKFYWRIYGQVSDFIQRTLKYFNGNLSFCLKPKPCLIFKDGNYTRNELWCKILWTFCRLQLLSLLFTNFEWVKAWSIFSPALYSFSLSLSSNRFVSLFKYYIWIYIIILFYFFKTFMQFLSKFISLK